jgi:uncharacterized protein
MTRTESNLPDHAAEAPVETRAALPSEDRFAAALRGFGPLGLLAILIILAGNLIIIPLSAILVLVWVILSHTPWREIGYVRPKSWIGGAALGIMFGTLFKLLMKIIVMPLLGAPAMNPAYHYLVGNMAALPGVLFAVLIGAGVGEETLFRGYMFERLGKLLGSSVGAKIAIVFITATLFGLVHYPDQGLAGVEQAFIVGIVYGAIYARTGRLWMLMWAHAAFDVVAVAIIYWNLQVYFAHLIFK